MTDGALLAAAIIVAAPLYAGSVFVMAKGAHAWGDAITAAHNARYHRVQADIAAATDEAFTGLQETNDKRQARAQYVPPTADEIAAQILHERVIGKPGRAQEYTTTANEGYDEEPPIPEGGLYRGTA